MKIRKLCYIANSQIPSIFANSIQVMKMCSAFAEEIRDVELIVPYLYKNLLISDRDIWEMYAVLPNFTIKRTFSPPYRFFRNIHGFLSSLYVRHRKPDLVYTRQMWAAYWLAQSDIPIIYESHNWDFDKRHIVFSKFVKSVLDSRILGIVTISQALADEYFKIGVAPEKILVLPDGVDLESFKPYLSKQEARSMLELPTNQKIAGYVGHLYEGRGIEEIIEAAEVLSDVLFLIVGGRPKDIERYKEIIINRNLKNVVLTGFVNNALVPKYLFASDVLLMPYTTRVPTLKYMSPLKMFEYMAANRPIIATDLPAIKEILKDKKNAILVQPEDAADIVRGIQEILNNEDLADRIAGKAREDVQEYTWSKRARRIVRFLNS